MPYTIQQCNAIQTMLLEKLRSQIQIYSQRQLSLRGRATITNSLILSKIWYCLRLFVPTQRFLKDVRSMIYQYAWQKKFPYVSLEQLTLSLLQGGVGLLDPTKQYLRIQMKWIFTLFMTTTVPVHMKDFLTEHFRIISPDSTNPLLPFFSKSLRHHAMSHPTSITSSLFAAFDQLGLRFLLDEIPLPNLLHFPLTGMFQTVPPQHWLHRYPRLPASTFLIFDSDTSHLRLKKINQLPPPTPYPLSSIS
ncbi:hypothetical protein G6F22_015002 [Rhizopus arrhizus]|nr:hypothetical protein G6F22_015002 [Rhizopus arrhizus]KAG1074041.1 hypothetical protein G6F42_025749 [Rhizopus arrhizus]